LKTLSENTLHRLFLTERSTK